MAGSDEVVIGVRTTGTEEAAASIAPVQTALTDLGAEGVAALDSIEVATARVDASFAKWETAATNRSRTVGQSFVRVKGQVEDFREEVVRTYGTLENAPAGVQAAWQRYGLRIDEAREKTRQLKLETVETQREMATGFSSPEQAIRSVEGTLGSTGAQLGIFAIALEVAYGRLFVPSGTIVTAFTLPN